jgi:WD40 repeat protein
MSNSLRLDDHADHPRRFLSWQEEYLLAYGGDDGTLTILVGKDGSSTNSRWIQARQWDDAIRAIAISPNGKRVAAGFETGAITIYVYDDYKVTNGSTKEPHPFFKKAWQKWQRRQEQQKEDDGDDDDDDHGLLSQSSLGMGDNGEDEELSFPGPPMSAPIRDLQFDPRCGGGNDSSSSSSSHPYFLAIATEAGFAISNVTSSQTLLPLLLQEAGEQGHDASGVRGLCYMQNSPPSLSSSSTSTTMLLATLAMDGRMCFWNVTHCGDPELDWELFHRDASKCIAKPDVGELNGADAADRSCRPFCIMPTRRSGNVSFLALPGQTDVMLRPMQHVQQQKFLPSLDGKGHIEPIVAMTGQGQYLVTSGRDGRVNLWKLPGSNQEVRACVTKCLLLSIVLTSPNNCSFFCHLRTRRRRTNFPVVGFSLRWVTMSRFPPTWHGCSRAANRASTMAVICTLLVPMVLLPSFPVWVASSQIMNKPTRWQ